MTDLADDAGPWFDQNFQQVDTQYNADQITIVHQLAQGPAGKQCPRCGALPMRRSQIVWEDNTRRSPQGTMILSAIAKRASPPRRPWIPVRKHNLTAIAWSLTIPGILLAITLSCTPALATQAAHEDGAPSPIALYLTIPVPVALWFAATAVFWIYRQRQLTRWRAYDQAAFAAAMPGFEAAKQLWRRTWLCLQCGAISAEQS